METGPASHRRLLLGVAGGVAAYKAAELARLLIKAGCQVQVVMTPAAQRFIAPITFQALTRRPVRDDLWDTQAESAMGHIELARWADAIVVAPATADFLARLAVGLADELLATLCLASDRPLYVAPAMNRLMWAHPATQDNLARLRSRGVRVLGPDSGEQACGEVGEGRMAEPSWLAAEVLAELAGDGPLSGVHAVVTAGPTREALDPVRYISNRSSGKQGYALAAALGRLGARVTLISGPVTLPLPPGVHRVEVESAQQMLEATLQALGGAAAEASLLVGTAAVADYRPLRTAVRKIKKTAETMELRLTRNPDILATARERYPQLFIVGFAAETERLTEGARAKLAAKKLDLVAANRVGPELAFDRDDNALQVLWAGGQRALGPASKTELAEALAQLIAERFVARRVAAAPPA